MKNCPPQGEELKSALHFFKYANMAKKRSSIYCKRSLECIRNSPVEGQEPDGKETGAAASSPPPNANPVRRRCRVRQCRH